MMAIRRGYEDTGKMEFGNVTLYSTLETCRICTRAPIWAKAGRVVYGAGRDDKRQMYFATRHVDTLAFMDGAYRDDVVIEGGCRRDECAAPYHSPYANVQLNEYGNL